MKIVILTTDTDHHTYFINCIKEYFSEVYIVYETRKLVKKYKTGPFFENEEKKFNNKFFKHIHNEVNIDKSKILTVKNVNCEESQFFLNKISPDICISFGTGLIKNHIFNIPKYGIINIHRGIVQKYRGLDSDLWAIFNNDLESIGTTIHFIDESFDTGNVISQKNYKVKKDDEIFHLKYHTTVIAFNLVLEALLFIANNNQKPKNYQQKHLGKYYSAMAIEDKLKTHEKFELLKAEL